jgi:hypothetical protein
MKEIASRGHQKGEKEENNLFCKKESFGRWMGKARRRERERAKGKGRKE